MIFLSYEAPFASFRTLGANHLRPTYPFAPPSALYGLVLNLAGIEMRGPLGPGVTGTAPDLPRFRLASAARRLPTVGSLFQQLHVIPVGDAGAERKPITKGAKHAIHPGRREVLRDVSGLLAIDAQPELEAAIRQGLTAEGPYGLPFLGDNNFFLSQLDLVEPANTNVLWLVQSRHGQLPGWLPIWCERKENERVRAAHFSYAPGPEGEVPPEAWVAVGPEAKE